jgi:O-antigen ligase
MVTRSTALLGLLCVLLGFVVGTWPGLTKGLVLLVCFVVAFAYWLVSGVRLPNLVHTLSLACFGTVTFNAVRPLSVPIADILLIAALGLTLAIGISGKRLDRLIPGPIVIFTVLIAASTVTAEWLGSASSSAVVEGAQLIMATVGLIVLARHYGSTAGNLFLPSVLFVAGCAVSAAVALLEQLGVSAMDSVLTGQTSFPFNGRSRGLTVHPNQLGLASALAIPFAIYLWGELQDRGRALAGVSLVLLLGGVAASGSRAAVLAVLVVFGVAAYDFFRLGQSINLRSLAVILTGSVLVIGLLAAASPGLFDAGARLVSRTTGDSSTDIANADRAARFDNALSDIADNPIFGVGPLDSAAHSFPIQVLQATGLVGLVAFVLLFAFAAAQMRTYRVNSSFVAAVQRSAMAWLVAGLFHNGFTQRYFYIPLVFAAALSAVPTRTAGSDASLSSQLQDKSEAMI